ncbi:GntP family permease [Lewinella sp. W8]|uniref:GntP family permease n=1 Tax=Lewinella sp. W8 TaxID=2528208 RepID=UPI00106860F8|nr:GntP family permease [Lewinella sp. W8]MTB49339.1 GntP family permease [Lewinella sp. W8]
MLSGIPLLLAIAGAVIFLILAGSKFGWHPFFALLLTALGLGIIIGLDVPEIVRLLKEGFGGLIGSVGLLIVLGSIIGIALERSGAARTIADLIVGSGTAIGLRLVVLGAIISIPVFCDSGFIILAGLLPALAVRAGGKVAPLALSLAGGLYLTHTLIPPTPGPLAAAANLGADGAVGTIMLLGALVAVPVIFVTWKASAYLGSNITAIPPGTTASDQEQTPSLSASLWPLLLPIILIALGSVLSLTTDETGIFRYVSWFTDPTIALLMGTVPALLLPSRQPKTDWIKDGLAVAGPILIITGLGGAFGAILKASPLASDVSQWVGEEPLSGTTLLLLSFGIAALLKTAQGSSTGALVITSGIVAPLLPLADFSTATDLALVTLAIGGGAMSISHANDSYFWVVTRFSGIDLREAYRSYTPLTAVMGVMVILTVLILHFVL